MAGKFIAFEGGEGAGKSTQIARLAERLMAEGKIVTTTREPGGTAAAESIRRVLLSGLAKPLGAEAEAMLFAAARADHVDRVVRPALAGGQWVLCDRFTDSTRVYQGVIGGVDERMLATLDTAAVGATRPNLTIVLDVPAEIGLARVASRLAAAGGEPDRFEGDALELHERRRKAYLDIAGRDLQHYAVIDAQGSAEDVGDEVWRVVAARLLQPARAA